MIQRERIAENVYSFQSKVYAQVNAGAVIGPNWAVVIDTLALPDEALEIRDFIEQEINIPIRYLINTHSHADHAWGNCFFPGVTIISHDLCRQYLDTTGRKSLEEMRKGNQAFRNVKVLLPHITFSEGEINIRVGKKSLTMITLPGHSADNIAVIVEEDRVMFSGDTAMPLPFIVDGDIEQMITSLKKLATLGLENVVQGHGDIILRGEIEMYVRENLNYLSNIRRAVRKSARRKYAQEVLDEFDIETCGKSHVLIGGLAEELHRRNLRALYRQFYGELPASSPVDDLD